VSFVVIVFDDEGAGMQASFTFGRGLSVGGVLVFQRLELVEDFEDRRLGVFESTGFQFAVQIMKPKRGGIQAVAHGVGQSAAFGWHGRVWGSVRLASRLGLVGQLEWGLPSLQLMSQHRNVAWCFYSKSNLTASNAEDFDRNSKRGKKYLVVAASGDD
jgi:hypothetical protein